MPESPRRPLSVAELRHRMTIALTVFPRRVFADLAKARQHRHEASRAALVDALTRGLDDAEITVPAPLLESRADPPKAPGIK